MLMPNLSSWSKVNILVVNILHAKIYYAGKKVKIFHAKFVKLMEKQMLYLHVSMYLFEQ